MARTSVNLTEVRFERRFVEIFDVPINLTARCRLFVEQHDGEPVVGGDGRRGEAGRPRTDNSEIDGFAHSGDICLPCCLLTVMPSATIVMQACRFAMPSISIRHSKHVPIRQ